MNIYNAWRTPDETIFSWFNASGMIVEELETGRIYRCNDGFDDEDFDDLIFKMEFE